MRVEFVGGGRGWSWGVWAVSGSGWCGGEAVKGTPCHWGRAEGGGCCGGSIGDKCVAVYAGGGGAGCEDGGRGVAGVACDCVLDRGEGW